MEQSEKTLDMIVNLCKNRGYVFPLSLIHISEPTRRTPISYAVFCLKKKKDLHAESLNTSLSQQMDNTRTKKTKQRAGR